MPVNYGYIKYTVPAAIYLNKQNRILFTHTYKYIWISKALKFLWSLHNVIILSILYYIIYYIVTNFIEINWHLTLKENLHTLYII